jgi:hypothetical protein
MMKWFFVFLFVPWTAWAACPATPGNCTNPTYNSLSVGITNPGTANLASFINIQAAGTASLLGGGTLSGTFAGNPIFSGAPTFATLNASGLFASTGQETQINSGVFDITSANQQQCGNAGIWRCSAVNAGSSATLSNAISDIFAWSAVDQVKTAGEIIDYDFRINVAPNTSSASGNRVGMQIVLQQVGSSQGGTITNSGISSALIASMTMNSNLGGTSTVFAGEGNAFNTYCSILAGATWTRGCGGYESDIGAVTGSSYDRMTHINLATLSAHAVKGYLNYNGGITIGAQLNATADLMYGLSLSDPTATYTFDPYARYIIAEPPYAGTLLAASGIDFGYGNFQAFASRIPFSKEVPLQAQAITAATRLTSNGAAASSFVYHATLTAPGTLYTSNPTITVTGCTGAVLNVEASQGVVVPPVGVYTPGTSCAAEATAAVSGGGGSGATVGLGIAGNTLNFPISSTVYVSCKIAAWDTAGDGIGWTIDFGATMGATASTTAIVGSPSWTKTFDTGSAPMAISAPTADTTFGAINITGIPTSVTASYGGKCTMTGSRKLT